ncbi:MAG TPA: hypothetical protein VJ123_00550 [Anaerolineales bacterium]|nr:hypothetical protein [Anaerolineales bacterium]
MKSKPGQRIALINAPEGYLNILHPLPNEVQVSAFALRPYRPGEPRQEFR